MNTPFERLKQARIAAGYDSAPSAAVAMGVREPTYMGHENGSRGFAKSAERYAKFFRTTPEWLMFGTGAKPKSQQLPPPVETAPVPGAPVDLAELRAFIQAKAPPRPLNKPRVISRRIPIVGEVAAGVWREAFVKTIDEIDEFLPIDVPGYERAELRALKVVGPSMNLVYPDGRYIVFAHPSEAGLRVGDHVVIERHKADLVELTLKEFTTDAAGRVALMPRSNHPDYQAPIYLKTADDLDQTTPTIIGVVVADFARRERPPIPFEPRSAT